MSKKDDLGNATTGDVMLLDTVNSFVRADEKLVALVGLDDVVVVSTKDATLVAHKNHVQDAKVIASKIKAKGRSEW